MSWTEKTINGFSTLDPAQLPPAAKAYYDNYTYYRSLAREEKEKFEREMATVAGLPPGQKLVFKYGFGDLHVGIGLCSPSAKPKPKRNKARTLEEVLKRR